MTRSVRRPSASGWGGIAGLPLSRPAINGRFFVRLGRAGLTAGRTRCQHEEEAVNDTRVSTLAGMRRLVTSCRPRQQRGARGIRSFRSAAGPRFRLYCFQSFLSKDLCFLAHRKVGGHFGGGGRLGKLSAESSRKFTATETKSVPARRNIYILF